LRGRRDTAGGAWPAIVYAPLMPRAYAPLVIPAEARKRVEPGSSRVSAGEWDTSVPDIRVPRIPG